MKDHSYNSVQVSITNMSFPMEIEGLKRLIRKNNIYGLEFSTDLDFLLNFDNIKLSIPNFNYHYWTAPKWFTKGDILLFYYGATSLQRARSMLRMIKNDSENLELIETIEHSIKLGKQFSGDIFGYTSIIDTPLHLSDDNKEQHFRNTIFAPFNEIHLFEHPLGIKKFSEYVRISNHGALTHISDKNEFESIKRLLSKNNDLPDYFSCSKLGDIGFKDVNGDNWIKSCSDEACFIHEEQIRAYMIDYLLKELKDNRTPLLKECECYKEDYLTGRVDYFVKIDSKWIPIEAKLNVLAEKDLESQIRKYINIDYFIPTKYPNKGRVYDTDNRNLCIVIDQFGIYLYKDDNFVDCEPGNPLWAKEEFNNMDILRKEIVKNLN